MFADDVTLYATGNDVSHIQSTLQGDLEFVLTWFRKNRLFVNPSKSSYLFVGTPQRTKHHSLLIKINGIILEQVEFAKLSGIYIHCNLTWKYHSTDLLKKQSLKGGVICRLSRILLSKLLNIMYRTVCQPYLNYCFGCVGTPCSDTYIRPLHCRVYRTDQPDVLLVTMTRTHLDCSKSAWVDECQTEAQLPTLYFNVLIMY